MKLDLIITQLRANTTSFAQRVAGAAQFDLLPATQALDVPCAFVIPLEDSPGSPLSQNTVRQELEDSFAVIVALSNLPDERGQGSAISIHSIRAELWKALLGWRPEKFYNGISYQGGSLLHLDRARMWYRFEFGAAMQIGPEDGWEQGAQALLPALLAVQINVDAIAPMADANIKFPGPDGRIEHVVKVNLPQ